MNENPMVRHTRWQLSQLGGPICKPSERSMPWPGPSGGCHACDVRVTQQLDEFEAWSRPMFVCVDCGNKRCPKACTASNQPGRDAKYPATEFRIEQVRALMDAHDLLLEEVVRLKSALPLSELPAAAPGPDRRKILRSTLAGTEPDADCDRRQVENGGAL